jgi:putative transposase
MANTYSQIYIQTVFAVKHRDALIQKEWRGRLLGYTTGILKEKGQKVIATGGYYDHIHLFWNYKNLTITIPDLVREVKKATNTWIKDEKLSPYKFDWQEGYGAFSYSHSQIDEVGQYVLNQEERHKTLTFREEYTRFLKKFEVEHDERYVFQFFDDLYPTTNEEA